MSLLARRPIVVPEGKGYMHVLTFTNPDGSARDMSDCAFKAEIRLSPDELMLGAFDFDTSAANIGLVIMSLPGSVTLGQRNLVWVYDAEWQIGLNEPVPFMAGSFKIEQAITQ